MEGPGEEVATSTQDAAIDKPDGKKTKISKRPNAVKSSYDRRGK